MVLGCYYLTTDRGPGAKGEGKAFSDFDEAKLAYDIGVIDLQAHDQAARSGDRAAQRRGDEDAGSQIVSTTMGRAIFNDAINSVLRRTARSRCRTSTRSSIASAV